MAFIWNLKYPTTRKLRRIAAEKIQLLERDRPLLRYFPITEDEAWDLEWEQRDNWRGFQQLRGLNGEPSYVKMVGFKRFRAEPGVYGEYMTIDEKQMTIRADPDNPARPINITGLITERQDYLNMREIDLIEYILWSLVLTGTFVISGPTGAEYKDSYPVQQLTLSDWTDHENSTPYKDLLSIGMAVRGKSVRFGPSAVIFFNKKTINDLLLNRNPDDLGGIAIGEEGFKTGTPMALNDLNRFLNSKGLPTIEEYDETYVRESDGAQVTWIPDNVGAAIGQRTNGDSVGEYRMTRNAVNGGRPGRYEEVLDYTKGPAKKIPPSVEVHRGHNGGPVLFYPSAILRLVVGPVV